MRWHIPLMWLYLRDFEERNRSVRLGARDLNRTFRIADNALGNRSEHEPFKSVDSSTANDDEVGADFARKVQDLVPRFADACMNEEMDAIFDRGSLEFLGYRVDQRLLHALCIWVVRFALMRQSRDLTVRLDDTNEVKHVEGGSIRQRDGPHQRGATAWAEIIGDDDLARGLGHDRYLRNSCASAASPHEPTPRRDAPQTDDR